MSNTDNSNICPFIKCFWEQQHQLAFVNIQGLIHYSLLFAVKLVPVFDVIHFGEKTDIEFLILARCLKVPHKNYVSCISLSSTFHYCHNIDH